MSFAVHHICADLHSRTNIYEADAKHYLWKLDELKQCGFSVATMPMMQLAADYATLLDLAKKIKTAHEELTKQTELT
jgi:hypothetical protein